MRRIVFASGESESASWARGRFVCMRQASRYMRPRLRMRFGSKLVLDARRKRRDFGRLRLEDRHAGAQRVAGADQRRMAPPTARGSRRAAISAPAHREPDEAAAPIEEIAEIERSAERGDQRRRGARRDRDTPDRAIGQRGERRDVAQSRQSVSDARRPESRHRRTRELAAQRRARASTDGTGPSTRSKVVAPLPCGTATRGQMRRAADLVRALASAASSRHAPSSLEARSTTVRVASGRGSTLTRDLGQRRERAVGAGHQLGADRSR